MLSPTHTLRRLAQLTRPRILLPQPSRRNIHSTPFLTRKRQDASPRGNVFQPIPHGITQIEVSPPNTRLANVTVGWDAQHLYLMDNPDVGSRSLNVAALRDSCACVACKDPASGQKSFASTQIPLDIGIGGVRVVDGGIGVTFTNDIERFDASHEMILPWEIVEVALGRKSRIETSIPTKASVLRRTGVEYWDREVLAREVRKIDYNDYMEGGEAFWTAVADICRLGIVYIKNVPQDEESVIRITTRIANIRETFYGRTFDVKAKPNAENVAYTSGYLGLHQDLLYLQPSPNIQVLHCMENSCAGGESLFSDGERVGRLLWPFANSSPIMSPLKDYPVPYQYNKHGYHYYRQRTVLDDSHKFNGVYWSPPFQGKHEAAKQDFKSWIKPARIFEELINDESAIYKEKMEPGECVLFDNLRVMHGRTAFDAAGGSRWLRGTYIAGEDFLSKASKIPDGLAEKFRGDTVWTPGVADERLQKSAWYKTVLQKVRAIDPSVEA